jgi:hypothetical protein
MSDLEAEIERLRWIRDVTRDDPAQRRRWSVSGRRFARSWEMQGDRAG